jgi:hypothetical protein
MHYACVTHVLGLSYSCVTLALQYACVTLGLRLRYACVTLALRLCYACVTLGLHLGYAWVTLGLRLGYACEFNINPLVPLRTLEYVRTMFFKMLITVLSFLVFFVLQLIAGALFFYLPRDATPRSLYTTADHRADV